MFSSIKGRIAVIVGVLALCAWALMPKEGPEGRSISPLNLGLDLQGGMHLALEIDDPDNSLGPQEESQAVDAALKTIRNRINQFGVREPTIQKVGEDRIIVELAGVDDPERAKDIVEQTAFLEFQLVRDGQDFREALPRIDRSIVRSLEPDELAAPSLQGQQEGGQSLQQILGGDTAAADTAPGDTAAADTAAASELRPLSALLLETGQGGGTFLVREQDVPTVKKYLGLDSVQEALPRNTELLFDARVQSQGGNSYRSLYVLEEEPMVTGEYLADAGPASRDPTYNQPIVPFEMTRRGARLLERVTSRHVNDQMAIVLDGRIQSAPVIRQTLSRRAQIELGSQGTIQEAQDLALVLRAGALPQPIKIVNERTVTASLGADSIEQGKRAFIIGLVLVVLLIIAYYRMAGLMAIGALGVYVVILLGGLAGLEATLTLPGIAGIILSVGMAVDANVLIFERIREELDTGKTPRTSVDEGFAHALSAIVDANLTTLITAAILFQFGTGPVKGFAVTLSIGILASFFSALFVTRTFFMVYLHRHAAGEAVSI